MQSQELGAVVRKGNKFRPGYLEDVNLNIALDYAKQHAWEMVVNRNRKFY